MKINSQYLIEYEKKFGFEHFVERSKISKFDSTKRKSKFMRGNDRMSNAHKYAEIYSEFLPDNANIIIELGILKGTGLAIWCDLYKHAKIIGLDIDISHYDEDFLIKNGDFDYA